MHPPTPPAQPPRRLRKCTWGVAAVAVLLALSGCSSGDSADSTSADAGSAARATVNAGVAGAPGDGQPMASAERAPADSLVQDSASGAQPIVVGEALIKTAAITLQSDDVAAVVAKIDELAARTGGDIASEDTSTNTAGVEVTSRIELTVPVADFDRAVDEIARLGDLVSKSRSSQDVTSRVVDVNSRVTSARDSIAQLRTLFNRATKLGDVIALERELSDREANLEALQSQQRSLAARTTMSTITVNVSRPSTTPPPHHDKAQAGFLAGLHEGWRALVAFVVGLSHGIGVVLPLGLLALCAAVASYAVVRRVMPRRVPHTSE